MPLEQFISDMSLTDIMLVGSAGLFFATMGVYAGLMNQKSIWSAFVLTLILLFGYFSNELLYLWLSFAGPQ